MKLYWSTVLYFGIIHISSATLFGTHKPILLPKLTGILDSITKPKEPSSSGFHIGTHIGTGSFGFGFNVGWGGSRGAYVPPEERPRPSLKDEEEKKVDHRPDWNDEEKTRPGWEDEKKEIVGPRPNWEDEENKERPKFDEISKEKFPDWEDIGEDDDRKSEDLMEGDLVADGLINPRINRNKRFIESRVYHVPVLFRSNAKPFQVKIRSNSNSLERLNSGM